MALIEYLPEYLRSVEEFQIINTVLDGEVESLSNSESEVLKQCFVNTADNVGLERMEKILSIENKTTDIELRRYNILARLRRRKEDLYSLLKDFTSQIEATFVAPFHLRVVVALGGKEYLKTIEEILEKYLPCNIKLEISLMYETHSMVAENTHDDLLEYTHNEIREEKSL